MEESKQPAALIIIDDDDEGDYGQRFTVNENKQTAKDVIVIPDDEDETEREQASRTVSVYSPKKNFKAKEEKGENNKNHQPQMRFPGIFETLEKRYPQVKKETTEIRSEPCYQTNKKRLKSPPSSPSLKQTTLNEESFSPKKRFAVMCRDPRLEQPVPYAAPFYCTVPLQKLQHDSSQHKFFSETQMNSIQALKEENFHQSVLATVCSFMNQSRTPPQSLAFYMLNSILLSKQSNCGKECFRVLKRIQLLHPVVPLRMVSQKITWEFISMIIEQCSVNAYQSRGNDLSVNASLALSFLVSVMEEEINKKTFSVVKTSVYRLLNVAKRASNVQNVISWIERAILEHGSNHHIYGRQCNVCLVNLLQRMLMLSLGVGERPDDCASSIGNEMFLVYHRLPSVELKTVFLQSTQSHLLRAKLIEFIVRNCCPLPHAELDDSGIHKEGVKHIIAVDFTRIPPGLNDVTVTSDSVNVVDCCEEFIMLLAYWLQSLMFCRKRSLQKNTSDSLRMFSMDDKDLLREIDTQVGKLRMRLENLCKPSDLSPRSNQLLELMSSLKSYAPNLL
ncbi:SUMO-interacting motif-containing protein 1-like isoform X2 [Montipora capricornis]|uniref:SUMO-interacting motif-containing protein 1-like isoform X2 n=1 Tax=Montipora capricornis TaxID=246305 RepID=UPI0035F158BD